MKKTTKNTKKTFKPVYTVDITDCVNGTDVLLAFANAKQKAGLPITDDELNAIIEDNSYMIILECVDHSIREKKPNIFKRFWNWITRKNK